MTSISTNFAHVTLSALATSSSHAISKGEVDSKITALIGTAPGILDTLGEIAASLNQDGDMYMSLSNMVTGVETTLGESINAVNNELSTEVGDREQAITDEAKARSDKDTELKTDVDSKASLAGATFVGDVVASSYLYIGTKWRIAASGSDLEFQYSADGSTFSVGVPFISA